MTRRYYTNVNLVIPTTGQTDSKQGSRSVNVISVANCWCHNALLRLWCHRGLVSMYEVVLKATRQSVPISSGLFVALVSFLYDRGAPVAHALSHFPQTLQLFFGTAWLHGTKCSWGLRIAVFHVKYNKLITGRYFLYSRRVKKVARGQSKGQPRQLFEKETVQAALFEFTVCHSSLWLVLILCLPLSGKLLRQHWCSMIL